MSGQITVSSGQDSNSTGNDSGNAPLFNVAAQIVVVKFDPTQSDPEKRYALVPNVVCDHIERTLGTADGPCGTAQFHYLIDHSGLYPDWPSQFEEIWPQTAQSSRYVIVPDDRIGVLAYLPDGSSRLLFDGFAQLPQLNLDPNSERLSLVATSCEVRAWDSVIMGRVQRSSDNPLAGFVLFTDLPCRFNPSDGQGGILPNCTPDNYDENDDDDGKVHPVFMEEHLQQQWDSTTNPDPRTYWTAAKCARYLIAVHNDEAFVVNPDLTALDELLVVKKPKSDSGVMNPDDPSTYTVEPYIVRDFDASNMSWPDALDKILAPIGFGVYFDGPNDSGANYKTAFLYLFRRDQPSVAVKQLHLDQYFNWIDPARNDIASASLVRDMSQVVNSFAVETPTRKVEVSLVLAPGFTPTVGDETSRAQFKTSNLTGATAVIRKKYRWYVADEGGDGHYDLPTTTWVTGQALDLTPIFPDDENSDPTYVARLRQGSRHLLTRDEMTRRRPAMLAYSKDYAGKAPAVWDGTGTWTNIGGGFKILDHRLGIEVDIEDPEQWHIAASKDEIKGISWQANPQPDMAKPSNQFYLLLTTVIDDDFMLEAVVPKRVASPTNYVRLRRIDARDHFRLERVAKSSWFNNDEYNETHGTGHVPTEDIILRDDTEKACDVARQYRSVSEFPPLAGQITIPFITFAYGMGDQISAIAGRNMSLRTNTKTDQGEAPRYPVVVKRVFSFEGDRQMTILHLTDLRAQPRA